MTPPLVQSVALILSFNQKDIESRCGRQPSFGIFPWLHLRALKLRSFFECSFPVPFGKQMQSNPTSSHFWWTGLRSIARQSICSWTRWVVTVPLGCQNHWRMLMIYISVHSGTNSLSYPPILFWGSVFGYSRSWKHFWWIPIFCIAQWFPSHMRLQMLNIFT